MAIRTALLDPAEVFIGSIVAPIKVQMIGGQTPNVAIPSTFSHVQGNTARAAGPITTVAVTLGAAPKPGNLVCIAVGAWTGTTSGPALVSVKDGNGNSYTITPKSPSSLYVTQFGAVWLAYLLLAPLNASATITATFAASISDEAVIWAREFSHTGSGIVVFDTDEIGSGNDLASTNTPIITPTYPNSLLYAAATVSGTIASAGAPWTIGNIEATSGWADEYLLSATAATAVSLLQNSATWDSMAMSFYVAANPAVLTNLPIPLGPFGRSVLIEGVQGGRPIPVLVHFDPTDVVPYDLQKVGGNPVSTASGGTQLVGIVGNADGVLDAVITAATAPANGLATLVVNRTTAPSLTTGQSVAAQADYVGSLFVKPYRRSQTKSAATTITNSAAATTVLAAQAAGIFADITNLVITVLPVAVASTLFTATLSDGTTSYVFDMVNGSTTTDAEDGTFINIQFNPPLPATTAATAWTLTLSVNTVTVHVTVVAALQKAS